MEIKSYKDLIVWQKSIDLVLEIYHLTECFPKEERYGLVAQMRNSANSVIANIAEAHGRYYFADKTRVLYTSRGECEETRSHLRVAVGLNYIDSNAFDSLDKEYEGLSKGISSYIRSLKKAGSANQPIN